MTNPRERQAKQDKNAIPSLRGQYGRVFTCMRHAEKAKRTVEKNIFDGED
jgi:hypothetical protein